MTITTVLVGYTTLAASLALVISLLLLRSLPAPAAPRRLASLPPSGPEPGSAAPPIPAGAGTPALDTPALGTPALDTSESAGDHLVAFLSSSCQACRTGLPFLLDYAGRFGDPRQVVAVIVGERSEGADLERRLAGLARIVGEPEAGPIAAAYRITGFPSYVLVSGDGTVLATGHSVLDLPQPQPQ